MPTKVRLHPRRYFTNVYKILCRQRKSLNFPPQEPVSVIMGVPNEEAIIAETHHLIKPHKKYENTAMTFTSSANNETKQESLHHRQGPKPRSSSVGRPHAVDVAMAVVAKPNVTTRPSTARTCDEWPGSTSQAPKPMTSRADRSREEFGECPWSRYWQMGSRQKERDVKFGQMMGDS